MRPSGVTPVASIIIRPAPEHAYCPTCMRCQSFMLPSSAEYWHIGDTAMRFGSVTPPRSNGVKSLGGGNRNSLFCKSLADRLGESHRARLVAVQAQRIGGYRHAFAREAGDVPCLDHRERARDRLRGVLDHAARLVARRERAVVGVAAVGEDLAGDAEVFRFGRL